MPSGGIVPAANGTLIGLARGGSRNGFKTNGPQILVGEGNPAHPEAVIATDPQYHDRNVKLWEWAGKRLGTLAEGGVVGASTRGGSRSGGGGTVVNIYNAGYVVTERQLVDAIHEGLLTKKRRSSSGLRL